MNNPLLRDLAASEIPVAYDGSDYMHPGDAVQPTIGPLDSFVNDPIMRALAQAQIDRTYDDTDYIRPDVGDVIADALETIKAETRDRAEDQGRCNKVDECTAKAIVLARFADWMEAGL